MDMTEPLAFVIEDDKNLSIAYAEAIKSAGYRAVTIRSGVEAVARLKREVPATIILDLHVPGVSGMEILKMLRADTRLNGVRVIVGVMTTVGVPLVVGVRDGVNVFVRVREPVRVAVGVASGGPFAAPWTKIGSDVALSMTAA